MVGENNRTTSPVSELIFSATANPDHGENVANDALKIVLDAIK